MVNINKIKNLAKEKGLKIKYICDQLGLSDTYLSNVKNGKDRMTDERLAIIADILNTTPEYLRDETDQKEKPIEIDGFEEKRLPDILYRYDELSDDQQREVLAFMEFKLAQQKEKPDDYIGQIAAFGSGPADKPYNEKASRDLARIAKSKRKKEQKD